MPSIRRLQSSALVCALATVAAALALAAPASAAIGTKVIADCNSHNTLTGSYTIAELENALRTMPADVAEYTSCHDVIQRALLAQEGKLHRPAAAVGGGSGGSFLPTPLIVALVVLVLGAAALATVGVRRRRNSLAD